MHEGEVRKEEKRDARMANPGRRNAKIMIGGQTIIPWNARRLWHPGVCVSFNHRIWNAEPGRRKSHRCWGAWWFRKAIVPRLLVCGEFPRIDGTQPLVEQSPANE